MIKNNNFYDVIVIDTSAILYDADCILKFPRYDIVIPLVVLDEVDKFRSLETETGRNARKFIRTMNEFRLRGDLNSGVLIDNDDPERGTLSIRFLKEFSSLSAFPLDMDKNDDRILAVCLSILNEYKSIHRRTSSSLEKVCLLTKDISLTVKAHVLGIECLDYSEDRLVKDSSELYSGTAEILVNPDVIEAFYGGESLTYGDVLSSEFEQPEYLYENSGVVLINSANTRQTALALYKSGVLKKLKHADRTVCNVTPRNKEQSFAMEMLMDPEIKLMTLTGQAGCGKTLMAVACGLYQSYDKDMYDRLVVSRPVQPLGKDIGYLPGSLEEKLSPWMGPIKDSVEYVFNGNGNKYDELISFGALEVEPLTYIRGRSLPRTMFILDEAQQLTRHEMKTIVSRIGEGSKIVLTGDVFQIDNHYLDTTNNGLTIAIEKFKEYRISGHVTLTKGQRSELATLAAEIL